MTWVEGFTAYLTTYEVRLHRRTRTFGGLVWSVGCPGVIGPERQLQIALAVSTDRSKK